MSEKTIKPEIINKLPKKLVESMFGATTKNYFVIVLNSGEENQAFVLTPGMMKEVGRFVNEQLGIYEEK